MGGFELGAQVWFLCYGFVFTTYSVIWWTFHPFNVFVKGFDDA